MYIVVIAVVVFSVVEVFDVWGGVEGQLAMAKHFRVIGSKKVPVWQ